jgi:hypothetical protein
MSLFSQPGGVDSGLKLSDLSRDGFWYLATPYSKFPFGLEAAFHAASLAAAQCLKASLPIYCPIAHTHPIAIYGGIEPKDHDIWLPADRPFMDAALGLIVCMMPSWEESYGISVEIKTFEEAQKPIFYMDWPE